MRTSRRRRGNNAIEFVLCLPIWFAVVMAIMDFGWLFYNQTSLDAAANLGCRAGSLIDPGDADENIAAVKARVLQVMGEALLDPSGEACANCALSASTWGDPPGRSLRCDVSRPFTPLIGMFVDDDRSLSSKQIARLEWQREAAPE
ncbi:pilus assembly protein [Myxococcota bacterium]|nr:pilus assembly protein [Myxococcota bacterium]